MPFPPFDFVDALAVVVDGANKLVDSDEMATRFTAAWHAYASVFTTEHGRIVEGVVGDAALWQRIRAHPDGREAVAEIIERIHAVHGEIVPGMDVELDVTDILTGHQIQ